MDYSLSDEQMALQQTARRFAQEEVAPIAAHYDQTGEFPREAAADLAMLLEPLAARECALAEEPPLGRLVFWCRPEVCATVRFGGWTAERTLRFPVFEAARPDVPAVSCLLPENPG